MDGGAWESTVHGVSKSRTRLHFHFSLSCIGKGSGNPLQYSCLEHPRDGRAWWAAVYHVAQSRTQPKRLSSSSLLHRTPRNFKDLKNLFGLPGWLSDKESTCQAGDMSSFHPWVEKFPWRRKWQPTPLFLPEISHGQRSPAGYSPWGCKRVWHDFVTKQPQ